MVVGEVSERCDVAVIGAGPGGYVAALRCAQGGKSVVLIERDAIGGTCLNVGCIPSKVLIHAGELASLAAEHDTGVAISATIDAAAMRRHRLDVVGQLTSGVGQLLDAAGVQRWRGVARFARRDRLVVETDDAPRHLEFTDVVVATGSRPAELADLPIGDKVLDSTGALDLAVVPPQMTIIGAGYIGIELGTAYAKLGSSVTIVEAAERILPGTHERLGREVSRRLADLGVTTMTSTMASGFDGDTLTLETREGRSTLRPDAIVIAVGRVPNTDGLGLESVGCSVVDGLVAVDQQRRAAPHVFAIGDITAGPALAHKATAEAETVAEAICGGPAVFDPTVIPEVVFSDPEIASVGHTVDSARSAGIKASSFTFPRSASARARTLGSTAGFVELVADEHATLIGGHIAGSGAAETIGEIALAIEMAATVDDLAHTIHAHPTLGESVLEAALGLAGRALHLHR